MVWLVPELGVKLIVRYQSCVYRTQAFTIYSGYGCPPWWVKSGENGCTFSFHFLYLIGIHTDIFKLRHLGSISCDWMMMHLENWGCGGGHRWRCGWGGVESVPDVPLCVCSLQQTFNDIRSSERTRTDGRLDTRLSEEITGNLPWNLRAFALKTQIEFPGGVLAERGVAVA